MFTLAGSARSDLLAAMEFPPYEMEMLKGMPLEGYHLSILAGIRLLLTVGAILRAKWCF